MTIAAVYRFDDTAIFLTDFRNTSKGNQTDVSLKFINIGESMGLFLSGDALFWQRAIPLLKQSIGQVNLANILNQDETFYTILSDIFWESQPLVRSRAIGFLIDDQIQQNILFSLDLIPQIGVRMDEIPKNSCHVIGSGALIPNIEKHISKRVNEDSIDFGDDLYRLCDGMRNEVQKILIDAGRSSFQKLGISPYMCLHTLTGSYFMIRGEEIEGEVFSENENVSYHYSFIKDNDSNEIILIDHKNAIRLPVNNITNLEDALKGDIFDPQELGKKEDFESQFLDRNYIYVFHQWVTEFKDDLLVYRSIKRIDFLTVNPSTRLEKPSNPIIKTAEFPMANKDLFIDCRDIVFLIDDDLDKVFIKELNENILFNHTWLSSYIPSYYDEIYRDNEV